MKIAVEINKITAGLDEVGRGCMMGRLYCGAVIFSPDEIGLNCDLVKDSKKFSSRTKRAQARDYILENCLDYGVAFCEPNEIDSLGLTNAWIKTMHNSIKQLDLKPEHILVDGNNFEQFDDIPYTCVIGGDALYCSIAGASVIAKVAHDEYIEELVKDYPVLKEYGIHKNMGYGTKIHMDAIAKLGLTVHHRKSFGGKQKSEYIYQPVPTRCLL